MFARDHRHLLLFLDIPISPRQLDRFSSVRQWQCNYDLNKSKEKREEKSFSGCFSFHFASNISSFLIFHSRWAWMMWSFCHSFSSISPFFSFSVSLNWISSLHHHNWLLHKRKLERTREVFFEFLLPPRSKCENWKNKIHFHRSSLTFISQSLPLLAETDSNRIQITGTHCCCHFVRWPNG